MEADAAAAVVEALELEDSKAKVVPNEEGAGPVAEPEERVGVAVVKSKKKKKKKNSNSHAPACSREPVQVLPSQELVESFFPWKAVLRPRRGRCAIATRCVDVTESRVF